MDGKKVFFVEAEDHRRFRMVIRGDLGRLTVSLIRKYLKPQGVPDGLDIYAHGQRLEDHMQGSDFGLAENDVLQLVSPRGVTRRGHDAAVSQLAPSGLLNKTASPQEAELRRENRELREEIQQLREEMARQGGSSSGPASKSQGSARGTGDLYQNAADNVRVLSEALGLSLQLGHELTCSIGTEDTTIFITLDPPTERLYVYATLLTCLPHDPETRYKLYEVLLQGSLLSREVCGGGIGLSLENSVVLLSTALPIGHCGPAALTETMPVFISALSRWRNLLKELV